MRLLFQAALSVIMATLSCAALAGVLKPSPAPTYSKDIQPILKERCIVCHSQSTLSNTAISGGLALDTMQAIQKGSSHLVLVAGRSADSELIRRIVSTSPGKLMPKGGPPLPVAQIDLLKRWVDAGVPVGDTKKIDSSLVVSASAMPMPINSAALQIQIATSIKIEGAPLLKKGEKEAPVTFGVKIGPLPPITSLAYSPDGKTLAVGSYRSVTLWDIANGKPIRSITNLPGPAYSLAFRGDSLLLAISGGAAGISGEVIVVDSKTGNQIGPLISGHTDLVYSVVWSPDGNRLATASQDKTARLWEWSSGKEIKQFKDHSDAVTKVCFAPDGKSIFTSSQDHNVRRYDVNTGLVLKVFSGHGEAVNAVAVSPNGKSLISSGQESGIRWWNIENGETLNTVGGHDGAVTDLVFSKDGKFAASTSADHTVRLWDVSNFNYLRTFAGSEDWLYSAAFSPDGKTICAGGAEGEVRIWDTTSAKLRVTLLFWPPNPKSGLEWAVVTPEGYFDASEGWMTKLTPQRSAKLITAADTGFAKTLYRPDQVLKAWSGQPLETAVIKVKPDNSSASKLSGKPTKAAK